MVGRFFDMAMYYAVRGYEESRAKEESRRLLGREAPGATGVSTNIARAVLGELESRASVLHGDLDLRSVTFTVRLEPGVRCAP